MMNSDIFSKRATLEELRDFASELEELSERIGFKISSRGWCYQLESERMINKDQFDKVENLINRCRKEGLLPIDFVAEEEGRQFSGVETAEDETPLQFLKGYLKAPLICHRWYTPDWWDGEEYYIQMLVEKIDLKTLFSPVCERYHIPIATSKGWSSMLQRAAYARRFAEAEKRGLKCVLLYCGDHDPDGLRISEFIRSNLADISEIYWSDGESGYDPSGLEITRFGLNYDFIIRHHLTWINNLITGSGKNLADRNHKNHFMPYVQDYLKRIGARKCEANAIVPIPQVARQYVDEVIISYLGDDALNRFYQKRWEVEREMDEFRNQYGLTGILQKAIDAIDNN